MGRLPEFPVHEVLPDLGRALAAPGGAAVLEAPPGAGKSTLVPLELLLSGTFLSDTQQILMLEPRRLAARSVATRMAELIGEPVGETIGYRVRFESRVSARTRIEVVTEGILTRRIQSDPELSNVGLVIFDEFHERNLHGDLALALCLEAREALREDLRILVMSATLEDTAEAVAKLLARGMRRAQSKQNAVPILTSTGRMYPVEIRHLPERAIPDGQLYPAAIARAVSPAIIDALNESPAGKNRTGDDLLVFLPGAGEIRRVERALADDRNPASVAAMTNTITLPLYGDLGREDQTIALRPDARGRRKIILATPLAETSLTIEGVGVVIDSGLRRAPRYDATTGLSRLELVRISRASAGQRAGRAGRLGPGRALRLWSVHEHDRLEARTRPEILDADLAPLLLELAAWGIPVQPDRPVPLPFLDPPPRAHLQRAARLLYDLGALEITSDSVSEESQTGAGDVAFRISKLGREMVRLPIHPRLARMIVYAAGETHADQKHTDDRLVMAADLAALLSERDPLRSGGIGVVDQNIRSRLEALHEFRRNSVHQNKSQNQYRDPGVWRQIEQTARQLRQLVGCKHDAHSYQLLADDIGALLALGYPDRVGLARNPQSAGRYLLSSGQGVTLQDSESRSDAVSPANQKSRPAALVVLDLAPARGPGGKGGENEIRLMAPLNPQKIEEIFADRLERIRNIAWDAKAERVTNTEELRYGALVLASKPGDIGGQGDSNPAGDDVAVVDAFLEGLREVLRRSGSAGLASNDADRESFSQLRARIEFLRQRNFSEIPGLSGEDSLPDLSEDNLVGHPDKWLRDHVTGYLSLAEFRKSFRLTDVIQAGLPYETMRWLDQAAPTHLEVPSGSRIRLDYSADEAILSVKLQELFGLRETPMVALGREAVTLHLLSPARRPIQVTRDLAGFWERTYIEVKKELKGRYPRHPWPDDPFDPATAIATRHTKKRMG